MSEIARRIEPKSALDGAARPKGDPELRGDAGLGQLLRASGIFDPIFYSAENPAAATDPLVHFLEHGLAAGRPPNALFAVDWYRERYGDDLAVSGLAPVVHYLKLGAAAGCDPHPLFQNASYANHYPEATAHGLTPLGHYLSEGEARGCYPNPGFDPLWYRTRHEDLGAWSHQPLLAHFAAFGEREGRNPHPLFDVRWYRERYADALERTGLGPLVHYLREGAELGYAPNPLFDPVWYRAQYGLDASNLDAFSEYCAGGWRLGRNPHPLFDAGYYWESVPAVQGRDRDALQHYVEEGAAIHVSPNPLFHSAWFCARYAVQLRNGETPLGHFIENGAERGWRPSPLFDFVVQSYRDRDPIRERESPVAGWFQGETRRLSAPGAESPIALPAVPPRPEASIVIPHYGPAALTFGCLRAISRAETRVSFEVIVVNDDPTQGFADLFGSIPRLRVIENKTNLGFGASCNRGGQEARGNKLVFLNNDTLPMDHWLDELTATPERFPGAVIVGAKLLQPNGLLQEAGCIVRSDGSAQNYGCNRDPAGPAYAFARPVDYVSGAVLLIDRERFVAMGGFRGSSSPRSMRTPTWPSERAPAEGPSYTSPNPSSCTWEAKPTAVTPIAGPNATSRATAILFEQCIPQRLPHNRIPGSM